MRVVVIGARARVVLPCSCADRGDHDCWLGSDPNERVMAGARLERVHASGTGRCGALLAFAWAPLLSALALGLQPIVELASGLAAPLEEDLVRAYANLLNAPRHRLAVPRHRRCRLRGLPVRFRAAHIGALARGSLLASGGIASRASGRRPLPGLFHFEPPELNLGRRARGRSSRASHHACRW